MIVEPTDTVQSRSPAASACASNAPSTLSHVPSPANRRCCFHTVCHGPNCSRGRSRQAIPIRRSLRGSSNSSCWPARGSAIETAEGDKKTTGSAELRTFQILDQVRNGQQHQRAIGSEVVHVLALPLGVWVIGPAAFVVRRNWPFTVEMCHGHGRATPTRHRPLLPGTARGGSAAGVLGVVVPGPPGIHVLLVPGPGAGLRAPDPP